MTKTGTNYSWPANLGPDAVIDLYRQLVLVRRCEERLQKLFADGEVPGFIHLSIGQEAISVGVMSALGPKDSIASTHRGHGHAIAKGVPLDGFFAEILGKDSGVCRGRGGSMHVADMRVGMLGANGIVGAGLPIAVGSAFAHRTQGNGNIAVAFFGDGAMAEGVLHESINIAGLWKLPILFVCEANGWSEFSPVTSQISFDIGKWAEVYGLRYVKVDGNDVGAVADAAADLVETIRQGGQPAFLECVTSRIRGHYEGDAQKYRPSDEKRGHDPILKAAEWLQQLGVDQAKLTAVAAEVDAQVEAAVAAARAGAIPDFKTAIRDVYTAGAN